MNKSVRYKNSEGYHDPTAGKAESNINKRETINQKRLDSLQEIEDFEQLCRSFRQQAEDGGFRFVSDIWLISNKTDRLHKGG